MGVSTLSRVDAACLARGSFGLFRIDIGAGVVHRPQWGIQTSHAKWLCDGQPPMTRGWQEKKDAWTKNSLLIVKIRPQNHLCIAKSHFVSGLSNSGDAGWDRP